MNHDDWTLEKFELSYAPGIKIPLFTGLALITESLKQWDWSIFIFKCSLSSLLIPFLFDGEDIGLRVFTHLLAKKSLETVMDLAILEDNHGNLPFNNFGLRRQAD